MNRLKQRNIKRAFRKKRTRAKIFGTEKRPRMVLSISNRALYAQLIDDENGKTLISSMDREGKTIDRAKRLGANIAKKALEKGIKTAVFHRGYKKYHGRVKAFVESAREAGLKI